MKKYLFDYFYRGFHVTGMAIWANDDAHAVRLIRQTMHLPDDIEINVNQCQGGAA